MLSFGCFVTGLAVFWPFGSGEDGLPDWFLDGPTMTVNRTPKRALDYSRFRSV
jgi:hypothetical protein